MARMNSENLPVSALTLHFRSSVAVVKLKSISVGSTAKATFRCWTLRKTTWVSSWVNEGELCANLRPVIVPSCSLTMKRYAKVAKNAYTLWGCRATVNVPSRSVVVLLPLRSPAETRDTIPAILRAVKRGTVPVPIASAATGAAAAAAAAAGVGAVAIAADGTEIAVEKENKVIEVEVEVATVGEITAVKGAAIAIMNGIDTVAAAESTTANTEIGADGGVSMVAAAGVGVGVDDSFVRAVSSLCS